MIPIVNKIYNCFDDGKINPSRLYTVKIKEIIPASDIDQETKDIWTYVKNTCHWLYAESTDYFIKYEDGECGEDGIFVRTKDGGWFGIGDYYNSGRLDVDGKLTETLNI